MVPEDEIRNEQQQSDQRVGSAHRRRGRRSGRGRRGGRGRRPGPGSAPAQRDVTEEPHAAPNSPAEETIHREDLGKHPGTEETATTREQEFEAADHDQPATTGVGREESFSPEQLTEDFEEPEASDEPEPEPLPERRSEQGGPQPAQPPRIPYESSERRPDFRPASPQSIQEALEQTNEIIETLRATLEDMEEVLETLELAERQKDADEREIEGLRRSLRQLHRPREGGGPRR